MMAMPAAADYANDEPDQQDENPSTAMSLQAIMAMPNIAAHLVDMDDLPQEMTLGYISEFAIREYKLDKESCEDWRERMTEALELAMLVADQKDYPFENASNVKYPMIATAALQFNARAYAAIIQGNRIVKCPIWGADPDGSKAKRADRVSEYMSYQLFEAPEWEEDTDRMLLQLPILGAMFRKCWYDPSLGRNVTRLLTPDRLVVNYKARSLEDAPRVTEKLYLYPYEINERIRDGRFIDFDYETFASQDGDEDDDDDKADPADKDAPQLFLEQHRLLDLDGDGYDEPYIVTIHYGSEKVCRIVANFTPDTIKVDAQQRVTAIRKQNYFAKYLFLPSPDGGFYGWGFGWLLKDITEAINTTFNELLDAGHMNNLQGGFFSSALGIREKSMRLERGEFRVVNTGGLPINQAVMQMQYAAPSEALFKLLGLLIESGKELGSVKDVLTGDTQATAPVGTTLALIEQGLQVFTSIFKRVYRSVKSELEIHARLNKENLTAEAYNDLVGGMSSQQQGPDGQPAPPQMFDPKADFDMSGKGIGIVPVADPGTATRMQKLAKAQAIVSTAKDYPDIVDRREALRRFYEAADVEDIDKLIMPPPQPDPEEEIIKRTAAELAIQKGEADVAEAQTQSILNLAMAESQVVANDLQVPQQMLATLEGGVNMQATQQQAAQPQPGPAQQ